MTLEVSSVGEGSVADMTFVLFPLKCMWDAGVVLKGLMTIKSSFCFAFMIAYFTLEYLNSQCRCDVIAGILFSIRKWRKVQRNTFIHTLRVNSECFRLVFSTDVTF